jgi:hypothetical protein
VYKNVLIDTVAVGKIGVPISGYYQVDVLANSSDAAAVLLRVCN